MYDKLLDTFKAVAETGSFTKAAVQKVKDAHNKSPHILTIGTSVLYPCHFFMDIKAIPLKEAYTEKEEPAS